MKINSLPWSPAFCVIPNCGTLGKLFKTASLKLLNKLDDVKYLFSLLINFLTKVCKKILTYRISFNVPFGYSFSAGNIVNFLVRVNSFCFYASCFKNRTAVTIFFLRNPLKVSFNFTKPAARKIVLELLEKDYIPFYS